MWKRPWNCIYYFVGFKEVYDNLIKKYFLSWTEKNCGYEMKKQMEILILLLLNMITTAFTSVVAAIKVLNDLITITKLSFSLGFRCNKFFMHLVLEIYIYFNDGSTIYVHITIQFCIRKCILRVHFICCGILAFSSLCLRKTTFHYLICFPKILQNIIINDLTCSLFCNIIDMIILSFKWFMCYCLFWNTGNKIKNVVIPLGNEYENHHSTKTPYIIRILNESSSINLFQTSTCFTFQFIYTPCSQFLH